MRPVLWVFTAWEPSYNIGEDTPHDVGTKGRTPLSLTPQPPATPTAGGYGVLAYT